MKVSDILESYQRPDPNEHLFTVEVEHEGTDGEYHMIDVSGVVTITTDAFNTGDSPTDYDVDIEEAVDKNTGDAFPINQLSRSDVEWIKDTAISQVTRNL